MGEEDTKVQLEEAMDEDHIREAGDEKGATEKPNPVTNDSATSEAQSEDGVQQGGDSDGGEEDSKMDPETAKVSKDESTVKDASCAEETAKEVSADESTVKEETEDSDDEEDADTSNENISSKSSTPMTDGKRDRKKVERLSFTAREVTKTKIEAMGAGLPLGDDPYIDYMFNHTKPDDLKFIHMLLYRRLGSKLEIKRNLRCFNGFSFTKQDEEYQSLINRILKWPMKANVVKALRLFGQSANGSKEELSERLAEFLLCPAAVDKPVPAGKRTSSASKKSSTKRNVGKAKKKASGKKQSQNGEPQNGDSAVESKSRRKSTAKKEESDSNEDNEDETSDGSDVNSDEEEQVKAEKTPAKKTPAKKTLAKKTPAKKTPAKKTPAKKTPAKKTPASKSTTKSKSTPVPKRSREDSDDESDDEPLVKKIKKSEPTDDDIKAFLEGFMKSVDLEDVTMRSIYQKVYDHYPDADITSKKELIKETVKKMLA